MDLTSYLAGLSTSMTQSATMNAFEMTMLSHVLDSAETEGAAIVNMMSSADIPPAGVTGHVMNITA